MVPAVIHVTIFAQTCQVKNLLMQAELKPLESEAISAQCYTDVGVYIYLIERPFETALLLLSPLKPICSLSCDCREINPFLHSIVSVSGFRVYLSILESQ